MGFHGCFHDALVCHWGKVSSGYLAKPGCWRWCRDGLLETQHLLLALVVLWAEATLLATLSAAADQH